MIKKWNEKLMTRKNVHSIVTDENLKIAGKPFARMARIRVDLAGTLPGSGLVHLSCLPIYIHTQNVRGYWDSKGARRVRGLLARGRVGKTGSGRLDHRR